MQNNITQFIWSREYQPWYVWFMDGW